MAKQIDDSKPQAQSSHFNDSGRLSRSLKNIFNKHKLFYEKKAITKTFENFKEPMAIFSEDGKVLYSNKSAISILNLNQSDNLFANIGISSFDSSTLFILPSTISIQHAQSISNYNISLSNITFGSENVFCALFNKLCESVYSNANKLILQNYPGLIFEIDQDGKIMRFVGGDDSKLLTTNYLSKGLCELLPKDVCDKILASVHWSLQTSKKSTIKYSLNLNHELLHFELDIVPSSPNSNRLFAYIRDITKYENTYSDLESLNKKLKSTWDMFEKMFSILVHDSNNYLNPAIMLSKLFDVSVSDILTNLQILFDKNTPNRQLILDQLNEDISTLGSFSKALCVSSDHLKNLLNKSLLQINMSGNMKYEKVNLGVIAMNEADAMCPLSMTKNVSIDCRVSPLLYVNTDSMMLSTIIRNLLSNAIKFTPDFKSVKITANSQSEKILVCIEDEGVGISESDQKLIFSNHAKHIGSETLDEKMRSQKNTGLGLVFVKDLLDMLGENITVQSELSKGTKFTFTLQKWDDY